MKKDFFRKNDIGIYLFLVLLAILLFFLFYTGETGENAQILCENQILAQLSLRKDQTMTIKGKNGLLKVEVRNGTVAITESECPDQVCVHTGWIQNKGQSIVCLPNQVIVRIGGENAGSGVDAVAG